MFTDVCDQCSHATEAHGPSGCGHCACPDARVTGDATTNGVVKNVTIDAPPAKAQGGGMTA